MPLPPVKAQPCGYSAALRSLDTDLLVRFLGCSASLLVQNVRAFPLDKVDTSVPYTYKNNTTFPAICDFLHSKIDGHFTII